MLSDAAALALAAIATRLGQHPPSPRHSYGLGRAEVIAATLNTLIMLFIVSVLVMSAIHRFAQPEPIAGGIVVVVALIGLSVNAGLAWLLHRSAGSSLNVRAAFLHVIADLLGSVAALTSGLVIWLTGWVTIDPILSLVICALILWSAWHLLREGMLVIMEGVPRHLDLTEVGHAIARVPHVGSVHDLHIWTLSSGSVALSAHLVLHNLHHWQEVLHNVMVMLRDRFQITHVTLQPECSTFVVKPPTVTHKPDVDPCRDT
jgi:cobalt-zinc-cadmium efflux system protein